MKKLVFALAMLLSGNLFAQTPYFGTLAGTGGILDSNGLAAQLNGPYGLAISSNKNTLVLTEVGNHIIRTVNIATARTKNIAGAGYSLNSLIDGVGSNAFFNFSYGLVLASDTSAYTADLGQGGTKLYKVGHSLGKPKNRGS